MVAGVEDVRSTNAFSMSTIAGKGPPPLQRRGLGVVATPQASLA
jgi:hypothetical protein